MFKHLKLLLVITAASLPFTMKADQKESIRELLKVMNFEKSMDDMIDTSVEIAKQMDPSLESKESVLRDFYNKYMSAESLTNNIETLYADLFSEKEIQDMIDFYNTETGKKVLEKMPQLMRRSAELTQSQIMKNMNELQEMLSNSENKE